MIKQLLISIALLCGSFSAAAQGEYNLQKRSLFEVLPITSADLVFLGNSITDGCEWAELFDNRHVKNRGISGDRTSWMLERLDPIIAGHPKKVFLMIGINDLACDVTPAQVVTNIRRIVDRLQAESRWTKIYIQSILPVNGRDFSKFKNHYPHSAEIVPLNRKLQALCVEKGIVYLDVWSALADATGQLDKRFTNDGLHLMGEGYLVWKEIIKPHVK